MRGGDGVEKFGNVFGPETRKRKCSSANRVADPERNEDNKNRWIRDGTRWLVTGWKRGGVGETRGREK